MSNTHIPSIFTKMSENATRISGNVLVGMSNILKLLYDEEVEAARNCVLSLCRSKMKQVFAGV